MKQSDKEQLFNCKGWLACNRIGHLAEMHHIFNENYNTLLNTIDEIREQYFPKEIFFASHDRFKRHAFNFLMSATTLRDNCRRIINYYKETEIKREYEQKVKVFQCSLVSFVEGLRNYNAHVSIILPDIVKSPINSQQWDIILMTPNLLQTNFNWSTLARTYMKQYGPEINFKDLCLQYHIMIDQFYNWLYARLLAYHKEDFIAKERLIDKLGLRQELKQITSLFRN